MHIYGGGNIYVDRDMEEEKTGSSDHFPKGTGCMSWFCPNNNKNLAYFKGYIYTQGISTILTVNSPKWWRSASNCGNMAYSELCNVFELRWALKFNSGILKEKQLN